MTFCKQHLLLLLSLLLFYIAMPNIYCHVGWVAWGAFVPLLVILTRQISVKKIIFLSWAFFQCCFLALLWINPLAFGKQFTDPMMGIGLGLFFLIFPFLFSSVVSLPFVFFRQQHDIRMAGILFFWVLLEYMLTIVPFGFPLSLALSQYQYPAMLQIAEYTGIFGLSAAIILTNLLFAAIFTQNSAKRRRFFHLFLGLAIPLCLILYGTARISDKKHGSKFLTVILVQPNIHWQMAYAAHENSFLSKRIVSNMVEITARLPPDSEKLIVFPELVLLPFNPKDASLQAAVKQMGHKHRGLLVGANYQDKNTILSLNTLGEVIDIYQKNTFVPVFESKENKPDTPQHKPLALPNTVIQIGPMICYETLFPNTGRELTQNGADFLGSLSFNSWLGHNNWPLLHMSFMPFRAVENQRASFFLNNTGPSIVTTPYGGIEHLIPLGKRGYIMAKIPVHKRLTWYTKKGPWPFLIFLTVCYLGSYSLFLKKKRG